MGARFECEAEILAAVANARRLHILHALSRAEMSVGTLASVLGLSQSATSQHLAKLRETDLVTARREGQTIFYSANSMKLRRALEFLAQLIEPEPILTKPGREFRA
jgi:DNA-binding transcriptional ArsR family regulator